MKKVSSISILFLLLPLFSFSQLMTGKVPSTAMEFEDLTPAKTNSVLSVPLAVGNSYLSLNVLPPNLLVDSIVIHGLGLSSNAQVSSLIQWVKSMTGEVYLPAYSINTIGNWILWKGYEVKALQVCTLQIAGEAIIPEALNIPLQQGWNLIGYPRSSAKQLVETFGNTTVNVSNPITQVKGIFPYIQLAKNDVGQVYWASINLNSIGNLKPGEAYLLKMGTSHIPVSGVTGSYPITYPIVFRYPANN